jgi:hypothetical protein
MISYIETYLQFGLYRIPVYSGFGLDRFHCIGCSMHQQNISKDISYVYHSNFSPYVSVLH